MILGINAVQTPIDYGVYSDQYTSRCSWDGFGNIEQLPEKIKTFLHSQESLTGLLTILGPGNYTGIRLSLTTLKMVSTLYDIPLFGVSLFEAYAVINPKNTLMILSSPSRKGWMNVQIFQSNSIGVHSISSILQIKSDRIDEWLNQFEGAYFWGHFGLLDSSIISTPSALKLDLLSVLNHFQNTILTSDRTEPLTPIYSYPAVS